MLDQDFAGMNIRGHERKGLERKIGGELRSLELQETDLMLQIDQLFSRNGARRSGSWVQLQHNRIVRTNVPNVNRSETLINTPVPQPSNLGASLAAPLRSPFADPSARPCVFASNLPPQSGGDFVARLVTANLGAER